jgi:hypothetical protein
MTNNEPLSGNLNDDVNANGRPSSAARPVDAQDLGDKTPGQYDDVDLTGTDADGRGRGTDVGDTAGAGTDAFGAGTAGVGDGTTGLTTGAPGVGSTTAATAGGAAGAGTASGGTAGGTGGSNLGDLGDPAHPFDQTNGIVEGLEGDSDEADTGDTTLP